MTAVAWKLNKVVNGVLAIFFVIYVTVAFSVVSLTACIGALYPVSQGG